MSGSKELILINWVQILGPSILMIVSGIITWHMKSKSEELRSIEEKLREKRRNIYIQILEPYIQLFTDLSEEGKKKAIEEITSYKYKKTAFELTLFGSDEVVKAYNGLLQHAYKVESGQEKGNENKIMQLMGKLLLEIRKSLGNKKTKLENIEMLEAMIKHNEAA